MKHSTLGPQNWLEVPVFWFKNIKFWLEMKFNVGGDNGE